MFTGASCFGACTMGFGVCTIGFGACTMGVVTTGALAVGAMGGALETFIILVAKSAKNIPTSRSGQPRSQ